MKADEAEFLKRCQNELTNGLGRTTPRDIINSEDFTMHHKRAWYILKNGPVKDGMIMVFVLIWDGLRKKGRILNLNKGENKIFIKSSAVVSFLITIFCVISGIYFENPAWIIPYLLNVTACSLNASII